MDTDQAYRAIYNHKNHLTEHFKILPIPKMLKINNCGIYVLLSLWTPSLLIINLQPHRYMPSKHPLLRYSQCYCIRSGSCRLLIPPNR